MSILQKIWRLFKVAKVLMSLNSAKFTRLTSLLSSPSPRKHLGFAHTRSLSDCINPEIEYGQDYFFSEKNYHQYKTEDQKSTPSISGATTPSSIDSSSSEQLSSDEDINKKAEDFISKMKRQISLDVAYTRTRSPSPPLSLGAPISPESYFNQMKEDKDQSLFSSVQSPVVRQVIVKPSSLNIRHPADSSGMNRRPSLVVRRPIAITR